MLDKGRLTTAAITIAIAFGAGHVMQYGFGVAEQFQQPAPRPSVARRTAPTTESSVLMYSPLLPRTQSAKGAQGIPNDPPEVLEPMSFPGRAVGPLFVPEDTSGLPRGDVLAGKDGLGTLCSVETRAEAVAGALIRLELDACERDIPVRVEHAGLVFHTLTGAGGSLTADIPAFGSEARVEVSVAGQTPVLLDVAVPSASWYDRVALAWSGGAPLAIHALEMGADPGSPGHVSAEHPRSPEEADAAKGGFIHRIGALEQGGSSVAEIYSFPSRRMHAAGTVRLSVAAEVTEATCGRNVPVRVVQSVPGGLPQETTVTIAFPGCEAVGNILVLKNLLEDLKIASN